MVKKHYHLAATKVIFHDTEDSKVGELDFNVILQTENMNKGIHEIDTIQKNAQMLFHQRMENPKINVIDVFIYGITYMGHMTPEQFTHRPGEKPSTEQLNALEETFGKKLGKTQFDV